MPWPLKRKLTVSPKQQQILRDVINSRTSRQDHRLRAQIILSWVDGKSENRIALMLQVNRTMVSHWKRRWFENEEKLTAYDECLSGIEYSRAVLSLLKAVSISKCNKVKFISPISFKIKIVIRKKQFCRAFPI